MMRKLQFIFLFAVTLQGHAQLVMNMQLPPSGVIQKAQLWNILVSNTGKQNLTASVSFMMSGTNGQQILSAKSIAYPFPPGNTFLNASLLAPIQYAVLSGDWVIDPGPAGFLPPGTFQVCYTIVPEFDHIPPVTQCNVITVEPLSPPQLITPENKSEIDTIGIPQFLWIPPAPVNVFTNLRYDFYLVQVDSFQTPAEAVHMNIPIVFQQNISANNLLYPISAPHLQQDVQYAWQIVATNNQVPVSSSQTWSFTLKKPESVKADTSDLPYIRLKKDGDAGYAICAGQLKFAYMNEAGDTSWQLKFYDISGRQPLPIIFDSDSIPLLNGMNLVKIDLKKNPRFINKHLYLMELDNSRRETWRLKFEFLKTTD